jgi:outer membrane protein assembly factor BamB
MLRPLSTIREEIRLTLAARFRDRFAIVLMGLLAIGVTQAGPDEGRQLAATGWKIKFNESGSNPVIADGVLYMGSADGAVYALDATTGETRWRFQTGENLSPATSGPQVITMPRGSSEAELMASIIDDAGKKKSEGMRRVDMTPAVENGTVFVGSGDQSFYAIDAATGKKKWAYEAGPGMASSNFSDSARPPALLKDGTVYFAAEDGLHALDALTGKRKWLFETLQEIPLEQMNTHKKRPPVGADMGEGVLFLTAWPYAGLQGPLPSFMYAVDQESGKAKWVTRVDGDGITAPTMAKGLVFFAVKGPASPAADSVTLYALDAAGGQVKWKRGLKATYTTPSLRIAGNSNYCSTDKTVLAMDLESGHELWNFSADGIGGDPQADDRYLYVLTHKGSIMRPKDTLHALALPTGQEKWSRDVNASIAMVHEGVVYADGDPFHAIEAATGKDLWTFKGSGRVSARLMSAGWIFLTSPTVTYVGTKRADQGYLYAIDAKTGKLDSSPR